MDEDATEIGSSTIWWRRSGPLATLAVAKTTCHWTTKRMTLDATIVDGSEKEFDEEEV